ncbi:MAG: hypothetical protein JXM70_24755 [Pirellulales bacterium]|nr:hypothetical protein [Pirellulales bacterium]
MIEQDNGRITSVAWMEICPWLIIFRAFRLAIRARFLIISAAAILATVVGWQIIGMVFSGTDDEHLKTQIEMVAAEGSYPWKSLTAMVPDSPGYPDAEQSNNITIAWTQLSTPFLRIFSLQASMSEVAFWLLCGLWTLAIWSFAGGAITRTSAVQLAADEKLGWTSMSKYVLARWRSYFAAPLFPMLGVVLVTIPTLILGFFLRSDATTWIAGLLWILPLAGGLLSAILLLGLLFGWPLMWATISSEGTDSFDALSRSYAYVFQRPLQYLFYAIVAAVLGALGWFLVMNFAAGVVHITYWSASWGAGNEAVQDVMTAGGGASVLRFWTGCVKILAVGYLFSYFWTAATTIYFVLRHGVDATEMDEVFLDGEAADSGFDLPQIGTDEQGAPVVEDTKPEDTPTKDVDASPVENSESEDK